jgi:hypothetical protein
MLEPWYKVMTLRKEVREGRSFDSDEFAVRCRPAARIDPLTAPKTAPLFFIKFSFHF